MLISKLKNARKKWLSNLSLSNSLYEKVLFIYVYPNMYTKTPSYVPDEL